MGFFNFRKRPYGPAVRVFTLNRYWSGDLLIHAKMTIGNTPRRRTLLWPPPRAWRRRRREWPPVAVKRLGFRV
jgi:hypothetical protein